MSALGKHEYIGWFRGSCLKCGLTLKDSSHRLEGIDQMGMNVNTPHEFQGNYGGISDRPCTLCGLPDRHPIHSYNQKDTEPMGIAATMGKRAVAKERPFTELVPLGKRVAIRQDEAVSVSKGGIEIPEDAQKRPATGTVLAVGPEVGYEQEAATQIRVGSRVVFSKYSGTLIAVKGQGNILVISEGDVFAILRDGAVAEVEG